MCNVNIGCAFQVFSQDQNSDNTKYRFICVFNTNICLLFVSASCNVTCKNGGYPAPDSCKCICPRFFKGEMCEKIDTSGLSQDCAGLELTDKTGSLIPPQRIPPQKNGWSNYGGYHYGGYQNGGYEYGKTCMWIIKVIYLLFHIKA